MLLTLCLHKAITWMFNYDYPMFLTQKNGLKLEILTVKAIFNSIMEQVKYIKKALIITLSLSLLVFSTTVGNAQVKNIVLVHGQFVDGSGWKPVYDLLIKKGYNVAIVQEPLSSLSADTSAVNWVLRQQNGPVILVGHSYGGALITVTGNNPKVKGLVYIAAHAPDDGESTSKNAKIYPPAYRSLQKGRDGYNQIDPLQFPQDFAGDLPPALAKFEAIAQKISADTLSHTVIHDPAWKKKPAWYVVAGGDRIINPTLERFYAQRAKAVTIEIKGASHSVYISHATEIAEFIIKAASGCRGK
jgi:pimeloyl-ACP methyl ester carboxylesterase